MQSAHRARVRIGLTAALVLLTLGLVWGWRYNADPAAVHTAATTQGAEAASSTAKRSRGARGDGAGGSNAERPLPVSVATVTARTIDQMLDALGTATALNTVTVRVRVDGQLLRILFTEGQNVRAGDLLAVIDPRPFEVALAQAQGQLEQNQAQLTHAKLDLARYADLVKLDAAPRQQLDSQQALVGQLQGAVTANQAAVDHARLQLSYTRVTAPISGRVGLRQVDAGNVVRTSDANGLVTITQMQPIAVVFSIPQEQLPRVLAAQRQAQRGAAVQVLALDRSASQVMARGTLASLDNQIDTTTGTLKMKAHFRNADAALFPNQFVNIQLRVAQLLDVPTVPETAIQRGAPGTFVYVLSQDSSVSVRPVKLGPKQGSVVAIVEGLKPGERVVTEGADKLREGAKVVTGNSRN